MEQGGAAVDASNKDATVPTNSGEGKFGVSGQEDYSGADGSLQASGWGGSSNGQVQGQANIVDMNQGQGGNSSDFGDQMGFFQYGSDGLGLPSGLGGLYSTGGANGEEGFAQGQEGPDMQGNINGGGPQNYNAWNQGGQAAFETQGGRGQHQNYNNNMPYGQQQAFGPQGGYNQRGGGQQQYQQQQYQQQQYQQGGYAGAVVGGNYQGGPSFAHAAGGYNQQGGYGQNMGMPGQGGQGVPPMQGQGGPQMQGQMGPPRGNPGMAAVGAGGNPVMSFAGDMGSTNSRREVVDYSNQYRRQARQRRDIVVSNRATGGSTAQGRALNKMFLDLLTQKYTDPYRLAMAIHENVDQMDYVNLATVLFHTGKKRLLLLPPFIARIAKRFGEIKEDFRAREASNSLYGMRCMRSDCPEVRNLVSILADKLATCTGELVAQAVGNTLYGLQSMTSEHSEVLKLLKVLAIKVSESTEELEAQNVGNALYGLRGMNSDHEEVRILLRALAAKIQASNKRLNGQAIGNSLYGMQGMCSKDIEVRELLAQLAIKISQSETDIKAQEIGNALYGLKRMSSDVQEVRMLLEAFVPKVAASRDSLDAQAIGNSLYGLQNMSTRHIEVRHLLGVMAVKINESVAELDGQAMGNSVYGLQGMDSDAPEVRDLAQALATKFSYSPYYMNAQEIGNSLYGMQSMSSDHPQVRELVGAIMAKVLACRYELTSQEIGNALYGLQRMTSDNLEVCKLLRVLAKKIEQSSSALDPQAISNALFGLQMMTSESKGVRSLVRAMTMKIELSWKLVGAQHISIALYGLQGLSSDVPEVRHLISAIVPNINSCRDDLGAKQLCMSLHGLRSMTSSWPEVRKLLASLADKASTCVDPLGSSDIGLAMFGLQGMSSDMHETRMLLSVLAQKIAGGFDTVYDANGTAYSFDPTTGEQIPLPLPPTADGTIVPVEGVTAEGADEDVVKPPATPAAAPPMEADAIGNSLFGLQNCQTDCTEASELLAAISLRIDSWAELRPHKIIPMDTNVKCVANSFVGLMRCSTLDPSVQSIIHHLTVLLQQVVWQLANHLLEPETPYTLEKTIPFGLGPNDKSRDDMFAIMWSIVLNRVLALISTETANVWEPSEDTEIQAQMKDILAEIVGKRGAEVSHLGLETIELLPTRPPPEADPITEEADMHMADIVAEGILGDNMHYTEDAELDPLQRSLGAAFMPLTNGGQISEGPPPQSAMMSYYNMRRNKEPEDIFQALQECEKEFAEGPQRSVAMLGWIDWQWVQ